MAEKVYHHLQINLQFSKIDNLANNPKTINWQHLDQELSSMLLPLSRRLNSDDILTTKAAISFSQILSSFLLEKDLLPKAKHNNREHP